MRGKMDEKRVRQIVREELAKRSGVAVKPMTKLERVRFAGEQVKELAHQLVEFQRNGGTIILK